MKLTFFSQFKLKSAAHSPQLFLLFAKKIVPSIHKTRFEGGFFRITAGRYDART